MISTAYEEIAAKAEWEGGFAEVLDWYTVDEVPTELQELWRSAKALKTDLDNVLDQIINVFEQHGVSF